MALIQHGSFQNLVTSRLPAASPALLGDESASAHSAGKKQPAFAQSRQTRGLALKSIRLTEGFEGFLAGVFSSRNEVYFVSWAWDMSGNPPFAHPEAGADAKSILIPMKVGKLREFIGQGVLLHPERKVFGGLAVRIMLWESADDARKLGASIAEVTTAIKGSKLTSLLSVVASAASVPTATLSLISNAAVELADVVAKVLRGSGDDYVDLYEGYYAASDTWAASEEVYAGASSEISLTKF